MKRIPIAFPADQLGYLAERSQALGLSIAAYVRLLVSQDRHRNDIVPMPLTLVEAEPESPGAEPLIDRNAPHAPARAAARLRYNLEPSEFRRGGASSTRQEAETQQNQGETTPAHVHARARSLDGPEDTAGPPGLASLPEDEGLVLPPATGSLAPAERRASEPEPEAVSEVFDPVEDARLYAELVARHGRKGA